MSKLYAALLGTDVGDAIALPYEGLSQRRCKKLAQLPLRHRFFLQNGMVSDDTDHSVFVVQAIQLSAGDVKQFRRALAWRLRGWFLSLPAGIGLATLRSCIKLWLFLPNSAVFSAGNGPAMRSAVIGAALANQPELRHEFVRASTELTHSDPKAFAGALALAEIAASLSNGEWTSTPAVEVLVTKLQRVSEHADWQQVVQQIAQCLASPHPLSSGQQQFGSHAGISGYILHSVPFAIIAWYCHAGHYKKTLEAIVHAGGDTDTVGAMAGALAGIQGGVEGIPAAWISQLRDWPHSPRYLEALASGQTSARFRYGLFIRSPFFMLILLAHGFRRLLPPY